MGGLVWCAVSGRRARAAAGTQFKYAGRNAVAASKVADFGIFETAFYFYLFFLCNNFSFSAHTRTNTCMTIHGHTHARCKAVFAVCFPLHENACLVLFEILFHFCALQVFIL